MRSRRTWAAPPGLHGRRWLLLAALVLFGAAAFLCVAANARGADARASPAVIRWDLASINGLQVTSESLGIRDRIQVVTLGTSGCTPRLATLFTINLESGAKARTKVPIQGRTIQIEIEDVARAGAVLEIECLESRSEGGAPRTFALSLDDRKSRP